MSKNSEAVKRWRDKNKKLCPQCKSVYVKHSSSSCVSCSRSLGDLTIEQATYAVGHRSSAFALIRSRARRSLKNEIKNGCEICKYNLHAEVCHIKPISEFPISAKISEVNSRRNLIILCPNHHWEFDNGILKINEEDE